MNERATTIIIWLEREKIDVYISKFLFREHKPVEHQQGDSAFHSVDPVGDNKTPLHCFVSPEV